MRSLKSILSFLACILPTGSASGKFQTHILFQAGVSDVQQNWARDFARQSLYNSVSFTEKLLQEQEDETRAIDLLKMWQEYLSKNEPDYVVFVLVASDTSQLKSSHVLDDTFLLLFGNTADSEDVLQKPFCAKRSIQLAGSYQTTLEVDDGMLQSETYPTNLIDFASVCYGIDHDATTKTNACVNGAFVEGQCKCQYGFRGDRCQYSDLAELDCSPGYAKMSTSWEPICDCPEPNGGRQYCGSPPCPGLCEQCSRRRGGNICGTFGIGQTFTRDVVLESPTFVFNELVTTSSPNREEVTTIKAATTTAVTANPIKDVNTCEYGYQMGGDCICHAGFSGQRCELGPLNVNCTWDRIEVAISPHYRQKVENYYVPNGSFHLCQSRESCKKENCDIFDSATHDQTGCGARVTKTRNTVTVSNNVFWKIPNRNSFVYTGHYECIFESKVSINRQEANVTCCQKQISEIKEYDDYQVASKLWRKVDGVYEMVTDTSAWVLDEPIIFRVEKADIKEVYHSRNVGFQSCQLTNNEGNFLQISCMLFNIEKSDIRVPVVENGCPTKFSEERLNLTMQVDSPDHIGLTFNAFNWKHGGQVFVQCEFKVCEDCDLSCSGRKRREVIHLQAKIVGHGQVTKGPLNAKSKEEDVVSREKLAYYKQVHAIVSCTTGALVALVLYKVIRYAVNQATSKPKP